MTKYVYWLAPVATFVIGFALAVHRNDEGYQWELERANQYEHSLATCRYVVAECWRGEDISSLSDSARASCGLPVKVRP